MPPKTSRADPDALVTLAGAHFGKLSAAETKLLEAAPNGELAVCGPSDNWDDLANDPAKASEWDADRDIRAGLIRWLCVDAAARERVDPKGIHAFGARIIEKLDLSYVAVPFGIALQRCRLIENAEFYSTDLVGVGLEGTWVRSLLADSIRVKGSVFLYNGFRAEGEVRLRGAQVGGTLNCQKSVFTNPSKCALNAERMSVNGSVFLRNGFRAEGEVRLQGAQIASNLECDNAVFTNPSQVALYADGINVKGSVFLRNGFRAEGEVRLLDAQISGNLECDNAVFTNPSQVALYADGINVKGSIFLRKGFCAEGKIQLLAAHVEADLHWWGTANPDQAWANLRSASVRTLVDDIGSWPPAGRLVLEGFTYVHISRGQKDANKRLEWLGRQESFAPQPYRQLAKVLREDGDDAGARRVLFEMERLRRQKEDRGRLARFWSAMLRLTIGFGYYPGRSLLWLLGLTVLSTILTWGGYAVGSIAPADKEAYGPFKHDSTLPPHYERFYPPVYALEHSFPLVKLGQAERWQPDPNPLWQCSSPKHFARRLCWVLSPEALREFRWGQICFGWFFTTMFVAGVTGVVRKD